MNIETTLKTVGIGGGLVAVFAMGAWALYDLRSDESPAPASAHEDAEGKKELPSAKAHRASERQLLASRARPSDSTVPDGEAALVETDAASLGAGSWVQDNYDQAYVYTGTALSQEERNARKGHFTEAAIRSREDEILRANPDMKEQIEAERVARDVERERYTKSGGLTREEEAMQKGIQLED